MVATRILLVDNGSLQPAATLQLRLLSKEVGRLLGETVHPVSVLHSHKIDPALLDGQPAVIFEQAVRQAKTDGIQELIILPLFIGPSRALTEFLPQVFAEANAGEMKLAIKPTLYGENGDGLRHLLRENLHEAGWNPDRDTVLLCDHGSPAPEVTVCRDALARDLATELDHDVKRSCPVIACSMERREGPEYAFNEPLLATALSRCTGNVTILMLFVLPGRHAGPGGDIETIAKAHAPESIQVRISPLLNNPKHGLLPDLIARQSGLPLRKPPHDWRVWPVGCFISFAIVIAGIMTAELVERGFLNDLTGQIAIWVATALFIALGFIFLPSRRR